MATSAPMDSVVLTSEIIGEDTRIPSAASTSTRMEPEVMMVWMEPSYAARSASVTSMVFRLSI